VATVRSDTLLTALHDPNEAGTRNHSAALRLELALVVGLPGAFLLGRHPQLVG
jgi:hypothetical protein